ncbi:MAG: anti-sigma factor domain-containing protein [Ruminococcus sp.]|nr:anti-sigma factor domain-containing protein [Ruminococcus sp.]
MKAAIVDLKGKYAAALTENGEVKKIFNNSYEIGQEIELYDIKEVRQPRTVPRVIRRVAAVAAAIIILTVGSIGTAYAIPCGTVSLESDPSIEYTVNCFDYVLNVRALNEDGETVIEEIGVSNLKHHKINDAVTATVEQMKDDGFFEDETKGVSITASTGNDTHNERLKEDLEDRVFNDMGIPQQNPNQSSEKNNPENNNASADDRQQKQDQEQAPNQDQQKDDSQQDGARQNGSPQDQNGGNAPEQNSGQNQYNGNQPQTQPKQTLK